MKLHRKWDCHERALENLGVQSLRRGGGRKSLHPHIIPRKRREAGCASAGTAARNQRVGVSLMKRALSSLGDLLRTVTCVTVHPVNCTAF